MHREPASLTAIPTEGSHLCIDSINQGTETVPCCACAKALAILPNPELGWMRDILLALVLWIERG
ncbi:hypothetical protein, partial [Synechococcus sp. R6-5]|uniref:hypothetical protein n=1 Tax=Synechococcus sp. R6-5 TaxID=2421326 RepID=UPI0039C2E785